MPAQENLTPIDYQIQRYLSEVLGKPANNEVLAYDTTTGTYVWKTANEVGAGGGAAPTTVVLGADYDVTSAGEKVMEITAPSSGLYVVELALGGEWSAGSGTFDGIIAGKVVGDIVGESDQNDFTANFRTFANVTGIPFYERAHATQPYATNIDFFWRNDANVHNNYAGTVLGAYQWMTLYLETGGKVELYLKDSNTNAIATGGYHRLLAGSKMHLRKVADFVYP